MKSIEISESINRNYHILAAKHHRRSTNTKLCVVSDTRKVDAGLTNVMRYEPHRICVQERVTYKLSVMVYHCSHATAPLYLYELCTPIADVASLRHFDVSA